MNPVDSDGIIGLPLLRFNSDPNKKRRAEEKPSTRRVVRSNIEYCDALLEEQHFLIGRQRPQVVGDDAFKCVNGQA